MTNLLLPQSGLRELTIEEILRRKREADAKGFVDVSSNDAGDRPFLMYYWSDADRNGRGHIVIDGQRAHSGSSLTMPQWRQYWGGRTPADGTHPLSAADHYYLVSRAIGDDKIALIEAFRKDYADTLLVSTEMTFSSKNRIGMCYLSLPDWQMIVSSPLPRGGFTLAHDLKNVEQKYLRELFCTGLDFDNDVKANLQAMSGVPLERILIGVPTPHRIEGAEYAVSMTLTKSDFIIRSDIATNMQGVMRGVRQ